MPDYQRGKIYKITSGDLTYIGSTTEPTLARRMSEHVSAFKRLKAGTLTANYSAFQVIDKGNYEITLVELCPCNSKDELTARERFYIENTVCVNKVIPGRTHDESRKIYYEKNKEDIIEKVKLYRDENKVKIEEYSKIYREAHTEEKKVKDKAYYAIRKTQYEEKKDKINERRRLKRQLDKQNQIPS